MQVADDQRQKPVAHRPTFFSARYGLQGRLDLMVEDDTDLHTVKTLSSSKAARRRILACGRINEMQVVGYNLLLRSTFGSLRTGSSAILYSAAGGEPLRNVVSNTLAENKLIQSPESRGRLPFTTGRR